MGTLQVGILFSGLQEFGRSGILAELLVLLTDILQLCL
jgi:hypothetical protein